MVQRLHAVKIRPAKLESLRSFIRLRMRANKKSFGLAPVFERAEQLLEGT